MLVKDLLSNWSLDYSIPSMEKIDAFVECSKDLSSANCSAICLARGSELMKQVDHLQAQFYHQSCFVRFVSTESYYGSAEAG
ncbi:hypothetical protein SUGI_0653050 [Cryptomeria japonica]|nr:hypothetical protein SUGI_0653050 [Cryptomeria japonica]